MSEKDEISKHLDSETDPPITSENHPHSSGETNGRGVEPDPLEESQEQGKTMSQAPEINSRSAISNSEFHWEEDSVPTSEDTGGVNDRSEHTSEETKKSSEEKAEEENENQLAPQEQSQHAQQTWEQVSERESGEVVPDAAETVPGEEDAKPVSAEKDDQKDDPTESSEPLEKDEVKGQMAADETMSQTAKSDDDTEKNSDTIQEQTNTSKGETIRQDTDQEQVSDAAEASAEGGGTVSQTSTGSQDNDELQEQTGTGEAPQKSLVEAPESEASGDKVSGSAQKKSIPNTEAKAEDTDQDKNDVTKAMDVVDHGPSAETATTDSNEDAAKDDGQKEATTKDVPDTTKAPIWEQVELSELDKKGLVELIEAMARHPDPIIAAKAAKKVRPYFSKLQKDEKNAAQEQFVKDGNDASGFAYRFDQLDNRFDAAFKLLKDRKVQRIKDLEREKESNYQEKIQLLEQLRTLVEAEETNFSINDLKKIQERWRSLGQVPGQYAKSLWANYHALLDLYYDRRSIYFELKELDRKKNLEAKLELCERAEKLSEYEDLRTAISELNDLHEEFKHIGPVPKSDQEPLWDRFKTASDRIYARRKEFVKNLKKDLKENLEKKSALAEEVQQFAKYQSDRISDWNKKTKELQALQKKWESIGGLPREHAKKTNRLFWGAFKTFFQHKGQFFKELEGERSVNLEKKMKLVEQAEALKSSTNWNETANQLKALQKDWRDIGPVPEKQRNEVYMRFKKACDEFFNNRRAQNKVIEKSYVENLKKKQDICTAIETMTTSKEYDLDKFLQLKEDFDQIGYVPGSEVRNIRRQFKDTASDYLDSVPEEMKAEARELKYQIEFQGLNEGPDANRRKGKMEQGLRREIGALENDISTWKNNLEFFAESRTADKLREEFSDKIEDANRQLKELKRQLRALRQM